jgi:hypothetical protein
MEIDEHVVEHALAGEQAGTSSSSTPSVAHPLSMLSNREVRSHFFECLSTSGFQSPHHLSILGPLDVLLVVVAHSGDVGTVND